MWKTLDHITLNNVLTTQSHMKTPLEEREQDQFNTKFIDALWSVRDKKLAFGQDSYSYIELIEKCINYKPLLIKTITEDQMQLIMSGQLTPEQIKNLTG